MFRVSEPSVPRFALATLAVSVLLAGTARADRLVLRKNFEVLDDVEVVGFDVSGVRLRKRGLVSWGDLQSGTVSNQQERFDELLEELGDPLFRIRTRLRDGDLAGVHEFAEEMLPRFRTMRSPTAYLVFQASMWSRLEAGEPAAAFESYLYCFDTLRTNGADPDDLPGERRLEYNAATGACDEIPPFTDAVEARRVHGELSEVLAGLKQPLPRGIRLRLASLAALAGDEKALRAHLEAVDRPADVKFEMGLVEVQRAVVTGEFDLALDRLERLERGASSTHRPAIRYWRGRTLAGETDHERRITGILALLELPALHGDTEAELAGAALRDAAEALEALGETVQASRLRAELVENYANTAAGTHRRQELASQDDDERETP